MTLYAHPVDAYPVYQTYCTAASCEQLAAATLASGSVGTISFGGAAADAGMTDAGDSPALTEVNEILARTNTGSHQRPRASAETRAEAVNSASQGPDVSLSWHRRISGALLIFSVVLMLISITMLLNQFTEVRSDKHLSGA